MDWKKSNTDFLTIYRIFMKIHDAFGSVDEMRKFVESHNGKLNYHLFDFDWSDEQEYQKNMLLLIMSKKIMDIEGIPTDLKAVSQGRIREFRRHIDILLKTGRISTSMLLAFIDPNQQNQNFLNKLIQQIYVLLVSR